MSGTELPFPDDLPPPFESLSAPSNLDISGLTRIIVTNAKIIQSTPGYGSPILRNMEPEVSITRDQNHKYIALLIIFNNKGGLQKLYEGRRDYDMMQALRSLFDVVADRLYACFRVRQFIDTAPGSNRSDSFSRAVG